MVNENRLGHALLFLSNEGSGGLPMARAFAQYIVCEKVNPQQANAGPALFETEPAASTAPTDSCGECAACKKATQSVHPDIHFSYPVIPRKPGDKPISTDYIKEWRDFIGQQPYGNLYDWLQFIDAENKQGNITANECEDIIRKMNLKSFESRYKILIMWMPEMLGKEGNKLLKLIEEPPPDTLFIFVAENQGSILPTILSRTQLIRIPKLSPLEIEAALELDGVSVEKAHQAAAISNGSYHEALNVLQHADENWETVLRDWLNSIVKTGPVAQVKWVDEISKTGREKQKQFLKYFIHLIEHAIRLRAMGIDAASDQESTSTTDFALRLNKLCDAAQQEAIVQELNNTSYYIERNANAKLLFHALTIRLYHIISNKTVILIN